MNSKDKNFDRRTVLSLLAGAAAATIAAPSSAQSYPTRTVKIVTGYSVGSGGDLAVRVLAEQLGKEIGQTVIVEAKPGAGNLLAARAVKSAPPDGYTLFAGNPSSFGPVIMENTMDVAKELTPMGEFSQGDVFAYTSTAVPSLKALAEMAKVSPVRHATFNASSALIMAMLAHALQIKYENIPYRTGDQIAQALAVNDVQVTIRAAGSFMGFVAAGKMNVLLTFSPTRSPFAPDVPTATELGLPVSLVIANGLWAPPGTPASIVSFINDATKKALAAPKVVEGMRNALQYAYHSTPAVQLENLKRENAFYARGAALSGYVRN